MEHELKAAADYARCSQIWQRVAPDLDPYPSDSPAPLPAAPSPPACPALQLELLRRFIAGELESRCAFLRCARCAPSAAARRPAFAAAGTKSCISVHKLLQCVHKDLQRRHFYARCHQPRGRSGRPAGV